MTGLLTPKNSISATEEVQVIPNEAIRLRILANSNKESDQELKRAIRDEVNKEINKWVAELTSIEEARNVINSHLPDIEAIAKDVMVRENNVQSIEVDFGETVFPTKLYGQYLYPAGKYEAIKITLGEGEGENWWCVLFPPLCFLDFNSGTAVASESDATIPEESPEAPAVNDEQSNSSTNEGTVEQTQTDEQKVQATQTNVQEGQPTQTVEQEEQPIEMLSQTDQSVEQTEEPVEQIEERESQNKEEDQPKNEAGQEVNPPVYENQDEEPVKVKFFLVEMMKDLF